ncbi:MAG: Hsp70 family protein, partial [Clostridia bacterium]|nr:Hsp70 family protein [Clostridia bacterium]
FVTMASHLVYIKTRMLLSIEDEEAQSEMDALIQSLEERRRNENYVRVKALAVRLEPMSEFGRNIITRNPEPMKRGKIYEYDQEKADLLLAMAEIRNRAETTVFQSKKAMEDAGDKLTDGDKAPVQAAIAKLEETLKSGTTEAIKADTEALEKALYELSSKLYQQPGAQGDQGGNPGAGGDDTVYDADFTDKTN